MKTTKTLLLALLCLAIMTQCKKEQPTTEVGTVAISLTLNGDGGTRVEVNTGTGAVTYQPGDVIYVASGGKYIGTLQNNGTNFNGNITNPVVGQPLHFFFLGNKVPLEDLVAGATESCSVLIGNQKDGLPVIEYAPSNETYSATTSAYTAMLLNKCALVKFNVTTTSEAPICITGMKNKVTVDFATNTLTPSMEGEGVITLPAGEGEKWAILLPQGAMEAGAEGTAYSEDGGWTGSRSAMPNIVENGYLVSGIAVNVSTYVPQYVNLGLPSGTLWATCNLGATTPEGFGDCFAWGETETKTEFTESTYRFYNGPGSYTKYNTSDGLTQLQPEDDAATANWGSQWRMPTSAEWQELIGQTVQLYTTLNGVNGMLCTGRNGNSVFFPDTSRITGLYGAYWSNKLSTSVSSAYFYLLMGEELYETTRSDGLSIRPVHVAE